MSRPRLPLLTADIRPRWSGQQSAVVRLFVFGKVLLFFVPVPAASRIAAMLLHLEPFSRLWILGIVAGSAFIFTLSFTFVRRRFVFGDQAKEYFSPMALPLCPAIEKVQKYDWE